MSDSNDFWGKGGSPSQPPSDSNEGFWAKKGDAPKPDAPTPAPQGPASGFWAKGGKDEAPKPEAGSGFWTKAQENKEEAAHQAAIPEEDKLRARKRRRRKTLWISLASLAGLIILLVILA